jgi:SAM-dependent methyltransferase
MNAAAIQSGTSVSGKTQVDTAVAMRILVVIANYGTKNLPHLQALLSEYRRMPFQIDIVVLSNEPKNLGPGIEVQVGLPTANPWSLPFAYKPLLARRSQDYDLFIYTEDDVLITERNIRAFLRATEILPEDHIAGFLREEVSTDGKHYYSTIHGRFHWEPRSVMRRGSFTFARFTNDHSGCFMLTRQQLGKALASGRFLLGFRQGRYGYPETAATDPYTQCGFKKVIGISHLQEFCLPHLPNAYLGKLGLEKSLAESEIARLMLLDRVGEIPGPLFKTETGLENTWRWDKQHYEPVREDVLAMVPPKVRTVLSVGCGSGETEERLVRRGVKVVGIPLDCIIAVTAASRGIETVASDLAEARRQLAGRQFDCIVFVDSLHRFEQPVAVLKDYAELLARTGSVVVSAPNFNYAGVIRDRLCGRLKLQTAGRGGNFARFGFHVTTYAGIRRWVRDAGLNLTGCYREIPNRFRPLGRLTAGALRRLFIEELVLVGTRL